MDEPSVDKLKRCFFSKTKYYEIEKQITTIFPDQCLQMLEILKNVLEFDPTISTYNANVKATLKKREYRHMFLEDAKLLITKKKKKKNLLKEIVI